MNLLDHILSSIGLARVSRREARILELRKWAVEQAIQIEQRPNGNSWMAVRETTHNILQFVVWRP